MLSFIGCLNKHIPRPCLLVLYKRLIQLHQRLPTAIRLISVHQYVGDMSENDGIALHGKSAFGRSSDKSIDQRQSSWWSQDNEGHSDSVQWAWRFTSACFTTPTHHLPSERRCLNTNSPRSDPGCMWLLCPGYRWTIWASWSPARCCGYSEGTRAWSG